MEHIETDYKNRNAIISTFNKSAKEYKNSEMFLENKDLENAKLSLHAAANDLYQACEWSYKNFLRNQYTEEKNQGIISGQKYSERMEFKRDNRNYMTIRNLVDEVNRYLTDTSIDLNEIYKNANSVNNWPKHNGETPSKEFFKLVFQEQKKFLVYFFENKIELESLSYGMGNDEGDKLFQAFEYFNSNEFHSNILVLNNETFDIKDMEALLSIKWDMVLDFSLDSNKLIKKYFVMNKTYPKLVKLDKFSSDKTFELSMDPQWIQIKGDEDNPDFLVLDDSDLRKHRTRFAEKLISKFRKVYSLKAQVIVTSMLDNEKSVRDVISSLNKVYDYDENISFHFLQAEDEYIYEEENFNNYNISYLDFLYKAKISLFSTIKEDVEKIIIPTERDVQGEEYRIEDYLKSRDTIELVHKYISKEEDSTSPLSFYLGESTISWKQLEDGVDLRRPKQINEIVTKISDYTDLRNKAIIRVIYDPGVGGTTFMRRIAFEKRMSNPSVILLRKSKYNVDYLNTLYNFSKIPVLVYVDSNIFTQDEVKELHSSLTSKSFPFIILFFVRNSTIKTKKNGDIFVPKLTREECKENRNLLLPHVVKDVCKENLELLTTKADQDDELVPFILSLYAFDEKFKGVKDFVQHTFNNLSEKQKMATCFISLASYVNDSIDLQYFINGFETGQGIELFSNSDIKSLVKRERDVTKKIEKVKIKYYQYTEEILKIFSGNNENISMVGLLTSMKDFISFSRPNNTEFYSESTLQLLEKMFIKRNIDDENDDDNKNATYAPLIQSLLDESAHSDKGMQNDDAILSLFMHLTTIYYDVPHFRAHLARYYFYQVGDFKKGMEAIDKAIELSKEQKDGKADASLYHMKAMGYSVEISLIIDKDRLVSNFRNGRLSIAELNSKLVILNDYLDKAFTLYSKAQINNLKSLTTFTAEMKLCNTIIQFANAILETIPDKNKSEDEQLNLNYEWLTPYIDKGYSAYENAKQFIVEQEDSRNQSMIRIEECKRELDLLCLDAKNTKEMCQELLLLDIPNKPRYRRILARALQTENEQELSQIRVKEIINLMETNIEEEPSKPVNLRIWFNNIRKLDEHESNNIILALDNLNKWSYDGIETLEIYYYRYVIKVIQMVEGNTRAREEAKDILDEMKIKSADVPNKNFVQLWLGESGQGLSRLIDSQSFYKGTEDDRDRIKSLYKINGKLPSEERMRENSTYIYYKYMPIQFKPRGLKYITQSDQGKFVKFGIGFSFDGPKAYNNSIELISVDEVNEVQAISIEEGGIYNCEVVKHVNNFTQVRFVDSSEQLGSIHDNQLDKGYGSNNRPPLGTTLNLRTIREKTMKNGKKIWEVTMKDKQSNFGKALSDAFKKVNEKN